MKKIILYSIAVLSFFAVIFMSACKKDSKNNSNSPQGANEVWIQNMAYSPASITVPVHTTVTWSNRDGMTHTVTGTTGLFDSGNIPNGGAFSFQFETAGTYPYTCTIHSSMKGTVIVQ